MILVIGIGNPLRCDDGAGHTLATLLGTEMETLTGIPARVELCQQLTPELAMALADPRCRAIYFCDAAVGAVSGGTLRTLRLSGAESGAGASFTHDLTPSTVLAYACLFAPHVDWSPPPAWIVTVEGEDFDHGEGLSPRVTAALDEVPTLAIALAAELPV